MGSTISIIKPGIFNKIKAKDRLVVVNSRNSLRMANGEALCPVGETVLNISFRDDPNLKFSHSVTIAEREVPVILENDFMTITFTEN